MNFLHLILPPAGAEHQQMAAHITIAPKPWLKARRAGIGLPSA
jgi:hypothetical protein